jgi:hypothetical protein
LPQFGRTVKYSALFRYQSVVIGLTDPNSPAHFATLLVHRLSFGLISNFVFLYGNSTRRTQHQIPKLTAMLGVIAPFSGTSKILNYEILSFYILNALFLFAR